MPLFDKFSALASHLCDIATARSDVDECPWMLPPQFNDPLWAYDSIVACFKDSKAEAAHANAKTVIEGMSSSIQVGYLAAAQRAFLTRNLNQARANIVNATRYDGQLASIQHILNMLQTNESAAKRAR